jgi:hypothetical protein
MSMKTKTRLASHTVNIGYLVNSPDSRASIVVYGPDAPHGDPIVIDGLPPEYLTPDQARDLAERLIDAAKEASTLYSQTVNAREKQARRLLAVNDEALRKRDGEYWLIDPNSNYVIAGPMTLEDVEHWIFT